MATIVVVIQTDGEQQQKKKKDGVKSIEWVGGIRREERSEDKLRERERVCFEKIKSRSKHLD